MRTFIKRQLRSRRKKKAKRIFAKTKPYFRTYERVYHIHIRKSAGTSINAAFWGLAGYNLKSVKREPIIVKSPYVFVRNNKALIEGGNYFYGNSHIPLWKLALPEKTFVFCMLRDPYERLVSLYRYLFHLASLNPKIAEKIEPGYKALKYQLEWIGESFSDFLDRISQNHLQHQLYMFSSGMDVSEALANIKKIHRVYFHHCFDGAIEDLSKTLKLPLNVHRERSFAKVEIKITEAEKKRAKDLLKQEYQFYNAVLENYIKWKS